MPTQRDLVKEVIRRHSAFEGPTWEEAAAEVGLPEERLRSWQRRPEWRKLCRQVVEEDLMVALPIAVTRLIDTAHSDKSSAGVTAAKTLVDLCREDTVDQTEAQPAKADDPAGENDASDGIDFETLTKEEREFACRLLAKLQGGAAG